MYLARTSTPRVRSRIWAWTAAVSTVTLLSGPGGRRL